MTKRNAVTKTGGRLIGYARVSTTDQTPRLQRDALKKAGCDKIFEEKASGAKADRAELRKAIGGLEAGDTLIVWKLDRLARSLRDMLDMADTLKAKGANFRSLTESIDTGSAPGKMFFHIMGALAEFERETIRERVKAGMASAKRHGVHTGRPAKIGRPQAEQARKMLGEGQSWASVCRTFRCSKASLSRGLRRHPPDDD